MSQRLTLADAKASRIPAALALQGSEQRFVDILNEAQERLLNRGKWWGTVQKYAVCLSGGCITWPRQIATIEAVAICEQPITVRNQWFEFLENGPGLMKTEYGRLQLVDRGSAVAFEDITGITKKVRVYADVSEEAGSQILLQGYDENGNWIRTQDGSGNWINGEYVSLVGGPNMSSKFYSALTGVQKPQTNGIIRLYEHNTTDATQRLMAVYEWDEERPHYRRSMVVGLDSAGACADAPNDCEKKKVTVMAKMAFIKARRDTDYLMIGNLSALKLACMAVLKEENNLHDDAYNYMEGRALPDGSRYGGAIQELEKELGHFIGHGVVQPIRVQDHATFGAGNIEPVVGNYFGR